MRLLYFLLSALLMLPLCTHAQERNNADWKATVQGSITWQRVTSFGTLIVNTSSGLHGIDVESGKVVWSNADLANIDQASYQPIEGSPFVQVAKGGTIYIFEPFEGNVVFNSKQAGIDKIKESHILPKNGSILIQGFAPGSEAPALYMVDMATGKTLWTKEGDDGILTAFLELGNDEFLLATLWNIYKINSKSGDVVWEKPIDEETAAQLEKLQGLGSALMKLAENSIKPGDIVAKFFPLDKDRFVLGFQITKRSEKTDSQGKKTVVISYESGYKCLGLKDGSSLWSNNLSFPGKMGVLIFGEQGMIVCPDAGANTFVNYVDYSNGTKSWGKKGKGIKMKGGVNDYVITDAGILLISQKGGSTTDPNYIANLLDPDNGLLKFDKDVKFKGEIERTEVIGNNLFYATNKEAGVVAIATGAPVIAKPIKTASGLNVSADDAIYVFSTKDKGLWKIDRSSGKGSLMSRTQLKFEGKDAPNSLEVRNNGVCVIGSQNIAMFDMSGSIAYQQYYPAPRLPGIVRALNAAMAVRAYYIGAVSKVAAGAWGAVAHDPENPMGPEISMGISNAYNELGNKGFEYGNKYMAAVKKRFSASAQSPNFMFMITVNDKKDNRLIRVNKDTGEVMDFISLGKEKEPVYEVDNIYNRVYHKQEGSAINGYQF